MNRVLCLALCATGLSVAAEPANGQVAPRNASFSKSEAILGGSPSRLAAILSEQRAPRTAAMATPASYGSATRAIFPAQPRVVPDDRPDVFGSVALAVGNTALERRWNRIEHRPIGPAAEAMVASLAGLSPIEQLDAVNRYVNRRVEFVNDSTRFGRADLWLGAADTLRSGRGDCEDFAIAKLQILRRAGFAEKDLYLVILRDTRRQADHAVLVARADGRLLVLDNGTNRIVDSDTIPDYRPILTFAGGRSWTHGYRRNVVPVERWADAGPAVEAAELSPASDGAADVVVSIAF